jgi:hypothetical protein
MTFIKQAGTNSDDAELELNPLEKFQESSDRALAYRDSIWQRYREADQEAEQLKNVCANLQPGISQEQITPSHLSSLPDSSKQIVRQIYEDAAQISTLHNEIKQRQSAIAGLQAKVKQMHDLRKLGIGALVVVIVVLIFVVLIKGC